MNTRTKVAVAGVSVAALTGIVGVGVAAADSPTPATPSTGASATPGAKAKTPGAKAKEHKHHSMFQRALHGEATLGGKKHLVVDFQRGSVTKVSATSITVRSTDGFTASYAVNGDTKVRAQKQASTVGAVKTSDKVRVVGVKNGATVTAKVVVDNHG